MPQTSPERRSRWTDETAIEFLKSRGFKLGRDWHWRMPEGRIEVTEREDDAIIYLIEEWDFGGVIG